MNKFAIAALLAGTMVVPTVEASQVIFSSPAWRDFSYGGGEFNVDIVGVNGPVDFQTFCLEKNEGLKFGQVYDYTTSSSAELGGLGGGSPDPVSEGTSYLYSRFLNGSLAGYSFANSNAAERAARAASGRLLQDAIWALEDEQPADPLNPFIMMVEGVFGSFAAAQADGTGNIGALNPTFVNTQGTLIRGQSVVINLPDNGMAVMMLGGSLMLLGAVRRRMA